MTDGWGWLKERRQRQEDKSGREGKDGRFKVNEGMVAHPIYHDGRRGVGHKIGSASCKMEREGERGREGRQKTLKRIKKAGRARRFGAADVPATVEGRLWGGVFGQGFLKWIETAYVWEACVCVRACVQCVRVCAATGRRAAGACGRCAAVRARLFRRRSPFRWRRCWSA